MSEGGALVRFHDWRAAGDRNSIKKEGAPASFRLKTARSMISRERETKERQYLANSGLDASPDNKHRAR